MSALPDNPFFQAILASIAGAAIVGTGARGLLNIEGYGYTSGGGSPNERSMFDSDSQARAIVRRGEDLAMLTLQGGTALGVDPDNPIMKRLMEAKTISIIAPAAASLFNSAYESLTTNTGGVSGALGDLTTEIGNAAQAIRNSLFGINSN